MAASLFNRYIWLINTIYSAGRISKHEIDKQWISSPVNTDHEEEYDARSFHRHKEAIHELFGLDILCDRKSGNLYYLAGVTDEELSLMLNAFTPLLLGKDKNLRSRVLFEPVPVGSRWLPVFIDAMQQGIVLRLTYRSEKPDENGENAPSQFLLMPYCLKQFHDAWFVVGRSSKQDELTLYALDNIIRLERTPKRFKYPRSWKAVRHFDGYVGVDRSRDPQTITVRVTGKAVQRLLAQPLHPSQRLVEKSDDQAVFTFWLAPTAELAEMLRPLGSTIEILAPGDLRQRFVDDTQWQARNYGMNLHYVGEQLSLF